MTVLSQATETPAGTDSRLVAVYTNFLLRCYDTLSLEHRLHAI